MKQHSHHKDKTGKQLKLYVTSQEFELVKADFEASGYASMSAYLRQRLTGKGIVIHQPKEMSAKLDEIGTQLKRIGNNINQIAKKAHLLQKEEKLSSHTILHFNQVMASYQEAIIELSKAYRGILRKFS